MLQERVSDSLPNDSAFKLRRKAIFSTAALLLAGATPLTSFARGALARGPVEAQSTEARLANIYMALDANRIEHALELTDRLIADYPNFRLAYLIRGDLLLARARPIQGFGNVPNAPADRLQDLRDEALVRLHAYRERPSANVVPRYLLQLPPDQKMAVVVDTKRSRMYVYENAKGHPRFVADYYITQGKLGADKTREGDQRTPIGVYHITSSLPKKKLNDFYGSGALPLNYPNEWDRMNGRTGHGIWLHGVPRDTYSRPPRASDGCVVMANADLNKLFRTVQVGSTPVIISDKVEWLSLDDWNTERRALQRQIETWRVDWESRDMGRYLAHYSKSFASDELNLAQWAERKREVNSSKAWVKLTLKNVSMLRYPGTDDVVVVTFVQDYRSNNLNKSAQKRQYWKRENSHWKIVYEGIA